jgi:hypothetical protein
MYGAMKSNDREKFDQVSLFGLKVLVSKETAAKLAQDRWLELMKENILKHGISRDLSAIGSAMQNSPMTKAWKRMSLSTLNLVMMILIRETSCWSMRDVPADNKNEWEDNSLYVSQDIFDDYIQTV